MAFTLNKTSEEKFENFDDLWTHVQKEKAYTSRISIKDLLRQQAEFNGDKFPFANKEAT